MNMAKRNIASGIVLLVITGLYAWMTAGLPSRDIMPDTPGPSFFPWIITGFMALLSTSLVFRGLRGKTAKVVQQERGDLKSPMLMLAGFLIYIICLKMIGFIPTSVIFFAFLMWLFSERRLLHIILPSVLIPVGLYLIFSKGFQVILPVGPLGI